MTFNHSLLLAIFENVLEKSWRPKVRWLVAYLFC